MDRESLLGDPCELARRWRVRLDVMQRVVRAAAQLERELGREPFIISGFRTEQEQRRLRQRGRPAADPSVSTHTSCPATGVDISIGFGVTTAMRATFGRIVSDVGLRWGGGSPPDQDTGIPADWNHVDLGPRL